MPADKGVDLAVSVPRLDDKSIAVVQTFIDRKASQHDIYSRVVEVLSPKLDGRIRKGAMLTEP
jgi:hypothetical protein